MLKSEFDGTVLQYIGWSILSFLITFFTFGIGFPWGFCMFYRWKINHTIIEGKRLEFRGSPLGLLGNYIKWMLLIIITLGIYSFWFQVSFEKWKVSNTFFVENFS